MNDIVHSSIIHHAEYGNIWLLYIGERISVAITCNTKIHEVTDFEIDSIVVLKSYLMQ